MPSKPKRLPLDEHLQLADHLAHAFKHLHAAFDMIDDRYPSSHSLAKLASKLRPNNPDGPFGKLRNLLDDEQHAVMSDEEHAEHGNIYYALDKRV